MARLLEQFRLVICAIAVSVLVCGSVSAQEKKLKLEEVIAHHLDSIGSAQARTAAKNRVVSGSVKQMHEVTYRPDKGSSDLKISLFFDATTFQHVRTDYEFKVPARLGSGPNDSARLAEDYYKLVEDFDDFQAIDALMIPRKYRLQLQVQTSSGSNLFDWNIAINQVLHTRRLMTKSSVSR
jgi:hypothetical protein